MRAPAAVAKTRIAISEMRPQFGERILEERRPLTYTHVNDDWFVLLDVGLKESGIFFTCLGLFCRLNSSHLATLSSLHETLFKHYSLFAGCTPQMAMLTHHHSRTFDHAVFRNNASLISAFHWFIHIELYSSLQPNIICLCIHHLIVTRTNPCFCTHSTFVDIRFWPISGSDVLVLLKESKRSI